MFGASDREGREQRRQGSCVGTLCCCPEVGTLRPLSMHPWVLYTQQQSLSSRAPLCVSHQPPLPLTPPDTHVAPGRKQPALPAGPLLAQEQRRSPCPPPSLTCSSAHRTSFTAGWMESTMELMGCAACSASLHGAGALSSGPGFEAMSDGSWLPKPGGELRADGARSAPSGKLWSCATR